MTDQNDAVHQEIQCTACTAVEIATCVSDQLASTAALLEQIAPGPYGLLITSLRWHAAQTQSGDFLSEYSRWVASNLNHEHI